MSRYRLFTVLISTATVKSSPLAEPRPNPVIDFIRVSYQSPRSGWKHKAWSGAEQNPRRTANKKSERGKRPKLQNPESLCSIALALFAGLMGINLPNTTAHWLPLTAHQFLFFIGELHFIKSLILAAAGQQFRMCALLDYLTSLHDHDQVGPANCG